jgi:phosphoglycerol transferase MdoB-like AlkP superfamily enzyme
MNRTEYIKAINKTISSKESENIKSMRRLLIVEKYVESLELKCESHLIALMLSRKEKQLLETQLREAQSTIAKLMDERDEE